MKLIFLDKTVTDEEEQVVVVSLRLNTPASLVRERVITLLIQCISHYQSQAIFETQLFLFTICFCLFLIFRHILI
jgi:hypothetical protein